MVRPTFPLAAANAAVLACAVLAAGTAAPVTEPTAAAPPPRPAASTLVAPAPAAPPPAPAASPRAAAPAPDKPPARPARTAAPRTTPRPAPAVRRSVVRTGWRPYAVAGPVTLHFPGDVVEVVGLHESGHDGAQPQSPVRSGVRIGLMGSRARDTNAQGSADVVVDPRRPVRSPVTGTVLRAGTYTLYCDHVDHYLVIEPEARPGWEVKLLHFDGLRVAKGDRVQAGVTVVGSNARVLPFASQVDRHTAPPHWPHLHIEVVDPTVPDRPSGGSCD